MKQRIPMALAVAALAVPATAIALNGSDAPKVTKVVHVTSAAPAPAAPPAPTPTARPAHRAPQAVAAATTPTTQRGMALYKCREKAFEDGAEFRFEYGRGRAGLDRCAQAKLREARFDCQREAVEDQADFRGEFGFGARALSRCIRHDLT
jgi:hypothetical protein